MLSVLVYDSVSCVRISTALAKIPYSKDRISAC